MQSAGCLRCAHCCGKFKMKNLILVGHRGARALAPENTWSGFMTAVSLGLSMIELDVHLSKDGVVVVMHDETVNRCSNGRGMIENKSWASLQKLDVGLWFGKRFAGERMPLLRDILTHLPHAVTVMIEIKHQSTQARTKALAKAVLAVVKETRAEQRSILASSNYRCLKSLGKIQVLRCFIYSQPKRLPPALADGFKAIDAFSWNSELWDAVLAAKLRKLKKQFYVWTINDPKQVGLWKKRGMRGLITDSPQIFV